MGVKIRNPEAAAKHRIEVTTPIDVVIRDTIIVRNTVPIAVQGARCSLRIIQMRGVIEGERLQSEIQVPVTLRQTVYRVQMPMDFLETNCLVLRCKAWERNISNGF